jgi:MoaA/NifB/PqqE/SkfB family radical SAM enzyme
MSAKHEFKPSPESPFFVDSKFKEHFPNLHQVFFYITDDCNLRCEQCLYKPLLKKDSEIQLETALTLAETFRDMGAFKLTIMGGEPTRYGHKEGNKSLLTLIRKAKEMGYKYTRIDTNGQFDSTLLDQPEFKRLDELSFSLDGHTPEINDPLRGRGSFNKCVFNMRKAVELGYNVHITCCIHRRNVGRDEDGNFLIDSMIRFASSMGVRKINFHGIFKHGVARDNWIGETYISPEEYAELFEAITQNIEFGQYDIPVRIPQERLLTQEEFDENPDYFGYCPVKLGERVLVHPNGQIRVCALLIGTPYSIARFDNNGIYWEESENNEITHGNFDLTKSTPCTNQKLESGFVPVCVSFKPRQQEVVWQERLKWESRRKI